ncbi:MAG: DNA sulfur modification protein DndD [Magnetococcales bacterium]|nr:DNA sulfur modification protein DndD [Magnetococcales bacterium]MBF0114663.1 DNA sulfur modification protein DndD [Magnetococcales bacterium]
MLFHEIEIANLFSYQGHNKFDLRGHEPARPIVLISGRNGYGKTSFLNSIKLLFCGPSDELRQISRTKHTINPKQYMLGNGEEWMGVFNRQQVTKRNHDGFYVRSLWEESDGWVDVRRQWFPDDSFDPKGKLTIRAKFLEEPLSGEEAQEFLGRRLPTSFLRFFFFDGEQIQDLAEADLPRMQEQIEGILNIAPINSLLDYLSKAKRQWAEQWANVAEKNEFIKIQQAMETLQNELSLLQMQQQDCGTELDSLKEQIADLERRRRALQGDRAREDEASLKTELRTAQERLAELRQEIVDMFVPVSPLVVNLSLIQKLLQHLEEDDQAMAAKKELLSFLRLHLPLQVFDRPVPASLRLHKDQEGLYRQRLEQALDDSLLDDQNATQSGIKLDGRRQSALRRQLTPVLDNPSLPEHARRLDAVSRWARKEVELRHQLDNISTNVTGNHAKYLETEEQLAELQKKQDEQKQRLYDLNHETDKKQSELQRKQGESRRQEIKMSEVRQSSARRQKADELIQLYKEYKEGLKIRQRKALEEAINRHFKVLLTGHNLVHHIEIDTYFGWHFRDSHNVNLGKHNLSAGMKQLAAIALLWALKDVSGKSVPVIIDTPLARIDRQNQGNLLRDYFPHVAEQVIILPTDSELDQEKYRLLAPYIYREFRLDNPQGDQTRVEHRSMYPD